MTGKIGYYVHHQGEGHYHRAKAIASAAPDRFVLLGTGLAEREDGLEHLVLDDDRIEDDVRFGGADGALHRPSALHYAPYGVAGVRRRVAAMATWIAEAEPSLMIVDVSVEAAMLARLASTPVVYVRLSGDRDDPAHIDAFRGAEALMAPWPAALESASTPSWIRDKTHYVAPAPKPVPPPPPRTVLVVQGRGGPPLDGSTLAASAAATPAYRWTCVGPVTDLSDPPANLAVLGWVDNIAEQAARHGVIVGAAGDGLVTTVLENGRAFICIPEDRAYDEQRCKAEALARTGAAMVRPAWPSPDAWAALLAEAEAAPLPQPGLLTGDGYPGAARWLLDLADRLRRG